MDTAGRRLTQNSGPTGQAPTSTLTRHYADTSDNPGWVSDPAGAVTRYGESIGGNLALTIDATTGATTVNLANPHGDVVTTANVPADGSAGTSIGGWSDYTEYGTPRPQSATPAGTGPLSYGWLGGKQRATTDTGLTLMGDRYYNPDRKSVV